MEWVKFRDVQIPIEPAMMSPKMIQVIRQGQYEAAEARHLPEILTAGDRLLELGGGVGFISSLAGRTGLVDSVTVYEAHPGFVSLIRKTHRANDVSGQAIWGVVVAQKRSDTVPFYVRENFWASSLSPGPQKYMQVIQVPCFSFAEVRDTYHPTVVVCDIEGGEGDLFRNVDLDGINRVLLEVHKHVLGGRGLMRIFDFFSQEGFFYDPKFSSHSIVLFRRLGQQAWS